MEQSFQLREVSDQEMIQIHKRAILILQNLKNQDDKPEEITMEMAVILAIFAVLNPENLPISDPDMEVLFHSYYEFMARYSTLN